MRITSDEILHVAALARLSLSDEEVTDVSKHFETMLKYVDKLNGLDTEGVEAMSHPIDLPAALREDEVTTSRSESHIRKIMDNAPNTRQDFFRVPKIVE